MCQGSFSTRSRVCLGAFSRGDSGDFVGRGGEGRFQRLGEVRQAFLRLIMALPFLPPPIAHLFLRLKVILLGIVRVTIKEIVVHGELGERIHKVSGRRGWAFGVGSRIKHGTGFDLTNHSPRCFRMVWMTSWSSMKLMIRMAPRHPRFREDKLGASKGTDLPRSSRRQAPIFWISGPLIG